MFRQVGMPAARGCSRQERGLWCGELGTGKAQAVMVLEKREAFRERAQNAV